MPITKKIVAAAEQRKANKLSAPMPADEELRDLGRLARENWIGFQKAIDAGRIVDVTKLIGEDRTFGCKHIIAAHGGYYYGLWSTWFAPAASIESLMSEIQKSDL